MASLIGNSTLVVVSVVKYGDMISYGDLKMVPGLHASISHAAAITGWLLQYV